MNMILLRGLPGTGKSTFAKHLHGFMVCSADDYFVSPAGHYVYNTDEIQDAHKWCLTKARDSAIKNQNVIVANTFSMRWELQPYLNLASNLREDGFEVQLSVLDLFDAGASDWQLAEWNSHGVPEYGIAAMRNRWEHDWKNGSPNPPVSTR